MKTFSELGISDTFIKALEENNITEPTPIQIQAIPFLVQQGTDFIGQAQTGTGKTAAYGLPILQAIYSENPKIQALILAPTRELGQQIAKQLFKFSKYANKKIFVESITGGKKIDEQIAALKRPTHIVVSTPGRLVDLLERKAIDLSSIKTIVLDEADEMLSFGFKKELDKILSYTAGKRHTWLFSATMPQGIKAIIAKYLSQSAVKIEVHKHDVINKSIDHKYVICENLDKPKVLSKFLKKQGNNRGIVFCRSRMDTQAVADKLISEKYNACALHGDLMQKEREKIMRAFKNTKLQILVATDIAARGIDVNELAYVVHYTLPDQIEYYTHRSGRTARAGHKGISLCLVDKRDIADLKIIERDLDISIKEIIL